ncbi:unnamed protein product [Pleuronectes platessa]|uniref:Uncharacterized protein n=1 Tax=Pleuronectes platessa TaxID=8262 RepID=A0A9N7YRV6_PLEPL|nr:unnamed protein product [Pleuronectes platessa]
MSLRRASRHWSKDWSRAGEGARRSTARIFDAETHGTTQHLRASGAERHWSRDWSHNAWCRISDAETQDVSRERSGAEQALEKGLGSDTVKVSDAEDQSGRLPGPPV